MFRSVSTSRVSDDTYYSIYNHSPTSKAVSPALRALALEANELPQHESSSLPSTAKKDKLGRARISEKSVHIIPLILLLCALILWLFSNPGEFIRYISRFADNVITIENQHTFGFFS
ncbi:hypothetical protein HanHA89_Chr14g0592741 [Helianthus annuus]|nr:hypothetical protein HanHA89_Chr14g0592741 [Helianthus annuus]